jgi:integrase
MRDYAVLMLMGGLGLRAIEISRLRLEDVHWRAGQITVRGKGGRLDRMPLPGDIGAAIASYLQHGRRPSAYREVFLRHFGPDAQASRRAIIAVPRRAAGRAGIPMVGAHRLRHRIACQVLAEGGNLGEIAQLLRITAMRPPPSTRRSTWLLWPRRSGPGLVPRRAGRERDRAAA